MKEKIRIIYSHFPIKPRKPIARGIFEGAVTVADGRFNGYRDTVCRQNIRRSRAGRKSHPRALSRPGTGRGA